MKTPNVLVFPDEKYDEMMATMAENGKAVDDIAFTALHDNFTYVIIRESFVEENDDDVVEIVLAHEMAHASGVADEEEADRKALETLNEHQQEILKEAWEDRHGHAYI